MIDLKSEDVFEGMWKEDLKEGQGKLISKKNNYTIEGVWHKNELLTTSGVHVNKKPSFDKEQENLNEEYFINEEF